MTEDITEHCRVCNEPCKLEFTPGDYGRKAGYIENHSVRLYTSSGIEIDGHPRYETYYIATPITTASSDVDRALKCSGSGKRSLEFRDGARKKKHDRVVELVDQVKLDAEIAYDAWQEQRSGFDYQLLVDIALRDYARRFPEETNRKLKVYNTAIIRSGRVSSYKMDVYCTFCAGLLTPQVSTASTPATHPKVVHHTTGCAILCLTGRREMVRPGERRLIDEDRTLPDDERPLTYFPVGEK